MCLVISDFDGLLLLFKDDFFGLPLYSLFLLHVDIGENVQKKIGWLIICSS